MLFDGLYNSECCGAGLAQAFHSELFQFHLQCWSFSNYRFIVAQTLICCGLRRSTIWLSNLTSVCHFHHALLHECKYSVVRLIDGTLLFKRSDESVLNHPKRCVDDESESSCPSNTVAATEEPIPTIFTPTQNIQTTHNQP